MKFSIIILLHYREVVAGNPQVDLQVPAWVVGWIGSQNTWNRTQNFLVPHFDFVQVGNREIQNGLFKLLCHDSYRPGVNTIMQADDRSKKISVIPFWSAH